MSRLIHEAIRIPECASLNSKAEWGGYKIPRLTISLSDKERREQVDRDEHLEKEAENRLNELKLRLETTDNQQKQKEKQKTQKKLEKHKNAKKNTKTRKTNKK